MTDVIAIDGPAGSGKSTIASRISALLDIPYINTGNMYRAVALQVTNAGVDLSIIDSQLGQIEQILSETQLDYRKSHNGTFEISVNGTFPGEALRKPEIAVAASKVAALPLVRQWLIDKQRSFASLGRIVMEGRDIGTVIFPDAAHKFFLTASPEIRARRRIAQGEVPAGATLESVAAEIAERDQQDSQRAIAPLRQADDATPIDSTSMTIDEVVGAIIGKVNDGSV